VYCDIDNDRLAAQTRIVPDAVNQSPSVACHTCLASASTFEVVGK